MTQPIAEKILHLRRLLHHYNAEYYLHHRSPVSDREFDALMHELEALEQAHPELYDPNSPTQRVGSDLGSASFATVRHKVPMLSLGNTYSIAEVETFYQRTAGSLGHAPFNLNCELKFDGLSISLEYEDYRLARAVTRGDGRQGDDVTENVRTIRTIPLVIDRDKGAPPQFEVRGEVLMPWSSFESLNAEREAAGEPLMANPRNAASGTLKNKSSAVAAKRRLDAIFYQLIADEVTTQTHSEHIRLLREWGFKVSDHSAVAHSLAEVEAYINHWDRERSRLPVATDGIVLKVDSIEQQQQLGFTSKSPKWAIAYKFAAERAETVLRSVSYQVGRTGVITPVANMDPVQLAGTVVKRASLHNEDIIKKLDLHVGDRVWVEKAGEIIPQIVGVNVEARSSNPDLGEKVCFVTHCPVCHTPLVRYEGEAGTYCPAQYGCEPQMKGRIEHFVSRDAMNIQSIGPKTIDTLYANHGINDCADLYNLRVSDLTGEKGERQRSAEVMVEGIAQSRQQPFDRVLYALGIRFVGKVAALTLARHFGSIDRLIQATPDRLTEAEGIGPVIAQSVCDYFAETHNRQLVERLRAMGLQMEMTEEAAPIGHALEGKAIVISGTFEHHSRDEYKQLIAAHGGKNTGSISAKTSFILAGAAMGPAKEEKARSLGIPLVSETDFLQMIGATDTPTPTAESPTPPSLTADKQTEKPTSTQPKQTSLFDDPSLFE